MKAMQYTVIRFMPHVQTREFANIGVIVACPKTGYFDYQINSKYSRLSQFFRYFDASVYRAAIKAFSLELERVRTVLQANPQQIQHEMAHIARPRETILQTSGISVCLATDEAEQLQHLFHYYVHHSFAKNQPEEAFTHQIVEMVKSFRLPQPFHEAKIGNDDYHIVLPLVQKQDNTVQKIIKPIYLGQEDAAAIYQKADNWIARFKRLRDFGWINKKTAILLPYQPPQHGTASQEKAVNHVLQDFKQHNISIAHQEDIPRIQQFVL